MFNNETSVLCTVVGEKSAKEGRISFSGVHYIEKSYSAGKIPGGYFKREGRPSEKETLTSRLIDRPIRPLFQMALKMKFRSSVMLFRLRKTQIQI